MPQHDGTGQGEARGRLEAQGKGGSRRWRTHRIVRGRIWVGEFARGVLAAGVNVGDGAGRRERECAGRPCWTNTNKQQAHTRETEPLVYVRRGVFWFVCVCAGACVRVCVCMCA